jgi:hypothetical protein
VSCALWNVSYGGDTDDALPLILLWKCQVVSCLLWNVLESGDSYDAISIYSALEMSECEYPF